MVQSETLKRLEALLIEYTTPNMVHLEEDLLVTRTQVINLQNEIINVLNQKRPGSYD